MTQNLTQLSPYEDEIDFREIFKILIESKKIILSSILIFTIASITYSLSLKPEFKSSSILEIGYSELPDGALKSIEKPSDLISNLNLYLFLNIQDENQVTSFDNIENKLILIETISNSAKKNENLLIELINYIDESHSNLAALINEQKKDQIYNKLDLIKSELSFIRAKQLDKDQSKKSIINFNLQIIESELSFIRAKQSSKIEDRLSKLANELPIIDLEIRQLEKVIIEDTYNLSLLKENENMRKARAANSPTLEDIIFTYESKINSLNREKSSFILEIKKLNNQLENLSLQSDELFNLEQRQKTLENELETLKNVSPQSDELFNLEQRQKTLEMQLQTLMTQTQINTRLIGNIETETIKPKTLLIIILGLIFGFITSIVLVFIRRFVTSYKESQA